MEISKMTTKKTIVGRIDPAVLSFTIGKDPVLDMVLAESDCIGSAAHVTMLAAIPGLKLFTEQEKRKVVSELVAVMKKARKGKFKIRNSDQDVHLAIERILTQKLGETGKKIHTARSRNDQIAVDMRLYGKEQLFEVMDGISVLCIRLLKLAQEGEALPMVGRTHLQPAMPSSVGLWASAHLESLQDDILLVRGAYDFNNRCPLGAAAGYGTALKIDRELTSRLLGFEKPVHNVLYAINARGKCEAIILSVLSTVMGSLSRLAEDIILYSMPEFGYFTLPKKYCTGSSIMPQKNNPDVLELVRAKAKKVLGGASTVASIVNGLPSGYNRDLQETKELFIDGMATTNECLAIMALIVKELKVNKTALLDGFTPDVFAADRVLELVGQGVPFRDAYTRVKNEIEKPGGMDATESIFRKKHLGATGGLNFKNMNKGIKIVQNYAKAERKKYYSIISKLIGAKYPELK